MQDAAQAPGIGGRGRVAGVVLLLAGFVGLGLWWWLRSPTPVFVIVRDIEFAKVGDQSLRLDLYLPTERSRPHTLILWIHGGGWRYGDRSHCPLRFLASDGYAIASIDYRLSPVALFPAQIHDCKAAVRWLRANALKHGLDGSRIVAAGESAGAHLALLLGTTFGEPAMDGVVGGHLNQSTEVAAVIDFFGSSDLMVYAGAPVGESDAALSLLLGGPVMERLDQARLASPIYWAGSIAAPALVLHAESDPVVPIAQSKALVEHYQSKKVKVQWHWQTGVAAEAAHNTGPFLDEAGKERIRGFLKAIAADR